MTELVCPLCEGLPPEERRPTHISLPNESWQVFSESTVWTISGSCTIDRVYVRGDTGTTETKFSRPQTMLPGDKLTVQYTVGPCNGCGGTGTWLDYARRRMEGKVDGPANT